MKRILIVIAAVAMIAFAGTAITMRTVTDDPAVWHVDPTATERTGRPNDYLVAPEGTTLAEPDRIAATYSLPPEELLFLLDAVIRPATRVSVLAGSVQDSHITYVQRSAVLGFPDYVSVKAVAVEGGSALIIWSRSRYGYSDMGVNKKRIDDWLAQIKAADG